jgi:hypothetical protein
MVAREVTETDYRNRSDDVIANGSWRKTKDPCISWLEWLVDHRTRCHLLLKPKVVARRYILKFINLFGTFAYDASTNTQKVSRKSDIIFGQRTIPEPSTIHIGKGVALDAETASLVYIYARISQIAEIHTSFYATERDD